MTQGWNWLWLSDARAGIIALAAAWGVHAFTASGAVLAFFALRAIDGQHFGDAFRLLLVAMAIDCVDGTLARAAEVKRVLPWFDGTKLDDMLASAYGFCRTDAKTADHYFRGFPSYWNVFAFYAFALRLSPGATAVWILALSALVFAPLKFLYPSRAPHFRRLTLTLGALWAVVTIPAVWMVPDTPPVLLWASLLYPAYYVGMSLWLQATGRA